MLTPEQRSLRARIAAHSLHAQRDPRETTARARETFLARFLREVDPEGVLPPAERQRRAEHARKAYFARLALRRSRKRPRRSAQDEAAPADGARAAGREVRRGSVDSPD